MARSTRQYRAKGATGRIGSEDLGTFSLDNLL
jgi:hypothetical protein